MYILVEDKSNLILCVASEICNLWYRTQDMNEDDKPLKRDKLIPKLDELDLSIYSVNFTGIRIGDEYREDRNELIRHPENYRQPTEEEKNEALIDAKTQELLRKMAVDALKDEGKLPPDYLKPEGK